MMHKDYIKNFVLSAVKQRDMLVNKHCNRKDLSKIDKYRTILKAYAEDIPTTPLMARFYVAHYEKILYMLPPSRHKQALELYAQCQLLIHN